ncbi:vacuolar protein sorting-associated protein [Verticillium alfalfae VaMs.102]|uniref:vesicle-fusing ATPase n=1 Tax=Verticillium alfalfae (strain VaMs.102 / ATCC MYA-4576 / FGSC 10136) TaxID=526221 RepID=C9SDP0_VERA1|nr:vacuolar protein sorting-associated protein [Verticillium alfalfae VaMs.102]EEY17160.1 vacuolar protein sorting-associated protein [Verticillium alfalfae VaMs.102]
MSNNVDFLGRAVNTVKQAIEADNAGEYEKAFNLYKQSLEVFVLAIKYEKNAKSKDLIRAKTAEYMDRAEKLKNHLNEAEAKKASGGKGAVGANGKGKEDKDGEDGEDKKLKNALSGAILQERPNVRWEDVAGLEAAKETLKEAVVIPIRFPSLFQGKRQPWKGILLYGPPGTVNGWGESERLVKTLFAMARENKPAVIFIDEIDALCSPRGEGDSEASRRIKTELLVQMDGVGKDSKGVLVLGATNIPWQLDSAIRRRFQRRIHIGLPDAPGRASMFKISVGDTETDLTANDYNELAKSSEGYSGSDIANVVQHALMRPVAKIVQATHYKEIMVNGVRKLTPCSPGDPAAKEMSWHDVQSEELEAPSVDVKDFKNALKETPPTVSMTDVVAHTKWTQELGSEGA